MFTSILFLLFSLTPTEYKQSKMLRKIIGGQDCSVEKYPFMVSIRTSTRMKHLCGGTLIKPEWVLTAAHCIIITNPNYYTVITGTSEINKNGIQRRPAKALFVHAKFNDRNFRNDIALIELGEGFNMSSKLVDMIEIPPFINEADVKDNCAVGTVIGWGHREPWNPDKAPFSYIFDPTLQCVTIPILSDEECNEIRGKAVKRGIFCTYAEEGEKDACVGDSGGPLFCGNIQYGIVSSGYGCGQVNSPGYYTRVDRNLDFIRDTILHKLSSRTLVYNSNGGNVRYSSIMILVVIGINIMK